MCPIQKFQMKIYAWISRTSEMINGLFDQKYQSTLIRRTSEMINRLSDQKYQSTLIRRTSKMINGLSGLRIPEYKEYKP